MKKILIMMVLGMMVVGNMAVAGDACKTFQNGRQAENADAPTTTTTGDLKPVAVDKDGNPVKSE